MSKKPKMVICRNCNAQIAKNAKVCPSCGIKNKKPFYKQWWFILIIILIVIGTVGSTGGNKKEKLEWKEIELCHRLPEPKSNTGSIISNSDDRLFVYVEKTSKGDYQNYIDECRSMGYIIEAEKDGEHYHAFDEEGYELSLSYFGETMHIELTTPEEMGTLNWPKSEIASLLPIPKSSVGKVSSDSSDGCFIYVGKMSADDFNNYVDECVEKGFVVDYERGDKFYYADDKNGNHISLIYQGNNVITIEIRKSDDVKDEETELENDDKEETQTESAETEPDETENTSDNIELVDGMRPEFKKAMDSYEEFMNEYCDFMKKYEESDGTDLDLLSDYADYMSKYADVVKDFEAWDSEELNAAEMAYYLDVQTRITKRLLEISQ